MLLLEGYREQSTAPSIHELTLIISGRRRSVANVQEQEYFTMEWASSTLLTHHVVQAPKSLATVFYNESQLIHIFMTKAARIQILTIGSWQYFFLKLMSVVSQLIFIPYFHLPIFY